MKFLMAIVFMMIAIIFMMSVNYVYASPNVYIKIDDIPGEVYKVQKKDGKDKNQERTQSLKGKKQAKERMQQVKKTNN